VVSTVVAMAPPGRHAAIAKGGFPTLSTHSERPLLGRLAGSRTKASHPVCNIAVDHASDDRRSVARPFGCPPRVAGSWLRERPRFDWSQRGESTLSGLSQGPLLCSATLLGMSPPSKFGGRSLARRAVQVAKGFTCPRTPHQRRSRQLPAIQTNHQFEELASFSIQPCPCILS